MVFSFLPNAPLFAWIGYAILQHKAQFRELAQEQIEKASAFFKDLTTEVEQLRFVEKYIYIWGKI